VKKQKKTLLLSYWLVMFELFALCSLYQCSMRLVSWEDPILHAILSVHRYSNLLLVRSVVSALGSSLLCAPLAMSSSSTDPIAYPVGFSLTVTRLSLGR
jgi:hypothetical protein